MFHLAHVLLYWLMQTLQPLQVPICFICTWAIFILLGWNIWTAIRDSVTQARRMHKIPCANCQFFTNNHRLKCPVHPHTALTDAAIDCFDYAPTSYTAISYSGDVNRRE